MDDLDVAIEKARAWREAGVDPSGRPPKVETPEEKLARLRSAADLAVQRHQLALDEFHELRRLRDRISGVLMPECLENIEECRRDAFHAQRKYVPFSTPDARLAAIHLEKELQRRFTGD
ncbi:hypothetical protein [Azotobacter chroococcum]|uniref:hypothetical protein n=1 Tax=Azotobacter chroococcum TaxID=353 RepID=UPI0010AEC4D5|nr:hypothetical protein [Azotobacter chroococcum]TKD39927.1 hypothetical protein FCG41_11885 [Azotobacter chroococcum]